jgi:arginine deiminase
LAFIPEVGKLKSYGMFTGMAHERLTPGNCDRMLFDDVLWVANAKRDHFDFMNKMREREVMLLSSIECWKKR